MTTSSKDLIREIDEQMKRHLRAIAREPETGSAIATRDGAMGQTLAPLGRRISPPRAMSEALYARHDRARNGEAPAATVATNHDANHSHDRPRGAIYVPIGGVCS